MNNATTTEISYLLLFFKYSFLHLYTYYIPLAAIEKRHSLSNFEFLYIFLSTLTSGVCIVLFSIEYFWLHLITSNLGYFNIFHHKTFTTSIYVTILSVSTLFVILFFSTFFAYLPISFLKTTNDLFEFVLIYAFYILFTYLFMKYSKFKQYFNKVYNTLIDKKFLLLTNILFLIILSFSVFNNLPYVYNRSHKFIITLLTIIPLIYILIKKAIKTYYKKSQYNKELEQVYKIIEEKDAAIASLTNENLSLCKDIHSLKHKIRFLTFKVSSNSLGSEFADDFTYYSVTNITGNLSSILGFTKATCDAKWINFEHSITCDISKLCMSTSDFEILLSDLLTNAIISMDKGRSINRNLKLCISCVDNIYSIDIYDSGIPFESNTLLSLGKCACSTHLDDGGSGIGFLNTFDTINTYNASICITEFSSGKYSKSISIRFDLSNVFIIRSSRYLELQALNNDPNCCILFEPFKCEKM